MKKHYRVKKHFKPSKFDPYIIEIAKYAAMGMSTREIAELIEYHFDDVVEESALYAFMRSRGVQSRVTMGGTNLEYNAPKCDECKDCMLVINTADKESRLCLLSRRLVATNCSTSPIWCKKRNNRQDMIQNQPFKNKYE